MALKLDSRQTRQRSKLDQLSTTTDLRLDAIMNLINDELTMPLRMRANLGSGVDGSPDQRLYIDSIAVKTLDTGAADSGHERSRTIPPIGGVLPNYTGSGYIEFNATTGAATASGLTLAGSYSLPSMTNGQFVKVLVWLSATSASVYQFGMEIGVPAASADLAVLPVPPSDAFALGYIVMTKGASTYSKVLNENIYQFVGGGGSGGGSGASKEITQANSFAVGDVVYFTGSTYAKAQANAANTAEAIGVVSKASASKFTLTELGYITGLSGLTPGEVYFLSDSVAGGLTVNEPTTIGSISKPMLIADSATSAYVLNYRGVVVGGANARTQISLPNNATTNVQLVAPAYDAGEMVGWVYIDGTTDLRFYISIQFSKNGAGTDYNVSYQTSGDTPPSGFSVSYASNYVRMTLPSIAGYASASFNYALNAPAVGTNFPLSVDGANVTAASATAQGTVTTGAQTFAGKKTLDGGALIKGDTSGIIPAGYIGEQLSVLGSELTTSTTGGVTLTLATLPITSAGVWKVEFYVWNIEASGVNAGAIFMANAKYNDSTFTPTIATNGDNSGVLAFVTQGAAIRGGAYSSIPGYVVATDGTKSVFLRQAITLSSGTAAARGKIVATRIA